MTQPMIKFETSAILEISKVFDTAGLRGSIASHTGQVVIDREIVGDVLEGRDLAIVEAIFGQEGWPVKITDDTPG